MCMGTPYLEKKQDRIRKEAQRRGYIRIYKVVVKTPTKFIGDCEYKTCKAGIQKAKGLKRYYWCAGWHGFRDYESAKKWKRNYGVPEIIIECLAKADWIIDTGHNDSMKTIRLKYICFPKFPNTKVTVKDFKEQYKRWKNGK